MTTGGSTLAEDVLVAVDHGLEADALVQLEADLLMMIIVVVVDIITVEGEGWKSGKTSWNTEFKTK